jgi:hypothetical protein
MGTNTSLIGTGFLAVVMSLVPMTPHAATQKEAAKTWSNVMYLGGAAGVRGKSLNWANKLTISRDTIVFEGVGKPAIRFEIPTASIRALDYSGHKHANDGAVNAGGVAAGLAGALLGASAKSIDHYVTLEYQLPDGTSSAILLRLHKDNQQEILDALRAVISATERSQ